MNEGCPCHPFGGNNRVLLPQRPRSLIWSEGLFWGYLEIWGQEGLGPLWAQSCMRLSDTRLHPCVLLAESEGKAGGL